MGDSANRFSAAVSFVQQPPALTGAGDSWAQTEFQVVDPSPFVWVSQLEGSPCAGLISEAWCKTVRLLLGFRPNRDFCKKFHRRIINLPPFPTKSGLDFTGPPPSGVTNASKMHRRKLGPSRLSHRKSNAASGLWRRLIWARGRSFLHHY